MRDKAERQNWRLDFLPVSVCQLGPVNGQIPGQQEKSFDLGKTLLGTTHEYELQLIKLVGIKTKALLEEI